MAPRIFSGNANNRARVNESWYTLQTGANRYGVVSQNSAQGKQGASTLSNRGKSAARQRG